MPTSLRMTTRVVRGQISLEEIRKNVTGDPSGVKIGLPDNKKHKYADLTLAHLGIIHEFGIPGHIPPRPFLVPAIVEGLDEIRDLTGTLLGQVQMGRTTKEYALRRLGNLGIRLVQEKIRHGPFQQLAESTKRMRRTRLNKPRMTRFTPLWDTGNMLQSVTMEVE